jgi:glycosyltransferase involved in cell wall biosynthesis
MAAWLRENRCVETLFAVMPSNAEAASTNPLLLRARESGFLAEPFEQKRRYDLLEGCRQLRSLIALHRADLVWATGYKADLIAAWVGSAPTLATLRGWTAEDAKVRFFEWLDRKSLRRHAAITTVSRQLRVQAVREGALPERVFWVPNAIDVAQLPPPRVRADFCREIGADPSRPLVGAVGRLSPEKGHRVLIEAFRQLKRRLPQVQLVLVGDGPEERALRAQAEDLDLSSSTTFTGHRADGQQIIGVLDVLALPSLSEGMPNVVLEAFAYGTPVVATAVGGVPDMLDATSGWLTQPGDAGALASAVHECLVDRPEAERRAVQARSRLEEFYTVEQQATEWLAAAEAALRSRQARRPELIGVR